MAKGGEEKMVSISTVAILLMAVGATSVTQKQLEMMSALDGTRTAKSFSHQVHEITKLTKEFKARVDAGEEFKPVQAKKRGAAELSSPPSATPTPKKPKATPKATPKARAKPKKVAVKNELEDDESPTPSDGPHKLGGFPEPHINGYSMS